jgi:hypothetical protein
MLKVTQKQVDKHNALNKRFNAENTFPDGHEIVPEREAQSIGGTYGSMYICILPDGSSHS